MRYVLDVVREPDGWWRLNVTGESRDFVLTARSLDGALRGLVNQLEASVLIGVVLADESVPETFIDGLPTGCCCDSSCECPCFQRVGLTSEPCCERCAPLPSVDDEDTD